MESKKVYFDTEEEWLKFKDEITVSASVIGGITGLNKYSSPFIEWERKTDRVPKLISTIPMLMGSYFEEGVTKIFNKIYPDTIFLRDRSNILMYQSVEYPFIAISPDDIAFHEGEEMLCEVKVTSNFFEVSEIPEYYKAQTQFQMGVSGYKKCLFVWLNLFKRDIGFTVMEFDEDYFNVLLTAAIQFNEFVVEDIPPPPVTHYDHDKLPVNEDSIEANQKIYEDIVSLAILDAKKKELEDNISFGKLSIKRYMGENKKLTYTEDDKAVTLATYGMQGKGRVLRINYKKI